ncbi:cytoplasmic protein [Salmonella enterica subsp. enterica serovar Oranienburg]|nr:cytoplasmic protein [Salmonella enterica subsp. enterica serovar Oranienburg]EDU3770394.1 cytoplasmic protein [Salmonella enterica subsp. enterica serovar Minnesota]EJQ5249101.1 cytoplasmic protein [Salmonella enterica]ECA1474318.1 cytoplasmic protein [Salmonella enterica subsp. enterica serovar Oranienburg]ECA9000403.1 cytoplasmic protein [Salmonella enterica subsp. enterica serovar Oranienburg]
MRVSEQVMLSALEQGGCIRSFWRRSARLAGTPAPGVPDGLALETPGESGDTPLSHVDFAVVKKWLVCAETWTQTVGGTEFGGAVWRLDQEEHVTAEPPVQGDGDQDEP